MQTAAVDSRLMIIMSTRVSLFKQRVLLLFASQQELLGMQSCFTCVVEKRAAIKRDLIQLLNCKGGLLHLIANERCVAERHSAAMQRYNSIVWQRKLTEAGVSYQ